MNKLYTNQNYDYNTKWIMIGDTQTSRLNVTPMVLDKPTEFEIPLSSVPNREWMGNFEAIQTQIQSGQIDKEILFRTIQFHNPIKPTQIMSGIKSQKGLHYILELEGGEVWFGNSPEKQIQRINDIVTIEVLGGTIWGNEKIGRKELEEHDFINDDLIKKIQTLGGKIIRKKFTTLNLGYVKHLKTEFEFQIPPNTPNEMIIHTIHPTLAIKSKTNDEKKFYGGLVGWETETELHLWLNIRCGMWNPKSLLYTFWTGCGITDKSNPIGEWGESNQKLKWLLK